MRNATFAATLIATATILVCLPLSAQEAGIGKFFRQLDDDGDGRLSKKEAGGRRFFRLADSNRDGSVTLEELKVFRREQKARKPKPAQDPANLPAADAPFAERAGAAADYSDAQGGAAVVILRGGKIAFERYADNVSAQTTHDIHSGTKGFWGPVVAAMIEDGLVRSFDELAADTLSEWADDPLKRTITLRHLLQLNAGLAQDLRALQGHDRSTLALDLYEHAVGLPVKTQPGTRFAYGPSCYYALGAILERKLAGRDQDPLEYLKTRILSPIGVKTGKWVHDASGKPHIPNGAWLTARDWAHYGQFLLQDGAWEGQQIVRADLLRELRQPSQANPGHGLALWLNRAGGFAPARQRAAATEDADSSGGFIYPDAEPDIFAALGAGKNRMYVMPSRDLVIVRQTARQRDGFEDATFLRLFLGRKADAGADLSDIFRVRPQARTTRIERHTFDSVTPGAAVSRHHYKRHSYMSVQHTRAHEAARRRVDTG